MSGPPADGEFEAGAGRVEHENIDPIVLQDFVQALGGKPDDLAGIGRLLNMRIGGVEVLQVVVQFAEALFEFLFLARDGQVEFVEVRRPLLHLLMRTADEVAEKSQHQGGAESHVKIEGDVFRRTAHVCQKALPEAVRFAGEHQQAQRPPTERGQDSEQKTCQGVCQTPSLCGVDTSLFHQKSPAPKQARSKIV